MRKMATTTGRGAGDIRNTITSIVVGIVLVVIGAISTNITSMIGTFIQAEITRGVNVSVAPLVPPERIGIVGTALTIVGIAIIVFAAVFMLKQLMSLSQDFGAGAGGGEVR